MGKKSHVMLLVTIFWMLAAVISGNILQRAVDMSLAVSCLVMYIPKHFPATSTQKMWLNRFNIFAMATAAVFLILEIYYMFFA